jgi:hypothetical protein
VPDVDGTDDPLHGHQEGRFIHGCFDCCRYLVPSPVPKLQTDLLFTDVPGSCPDDCDVAHDPFDHQAVVPASARGLSPKVPARCALVATPRHSRPAGAMPGK